MASEASGSAHHRIAIEEAATVVESAAAPVAALPSFAYTFVAPEVPHVYPSLSKDCFTKWGLTPRTRTARLSVTGGGRSMGNVDSDAFLCDLFNSSSFRSALIVPDAGGAHAPFTGTVSRVRAMRLNTNATSLSFFDTLVTAGALGVSAVLEDGSGSSEGARRTFIRKRLEETWLGLPIVDCAREALVLPAGCGGSDADAEEAEEDPAGDATTLMQPQRFGLAFDGPSRKEVLFRLARWVVAGGGMCQHEDDWEPYAAAVKDLARDFLTVTRGDEVAGGGVSILVASHVWLVRGLEGEGLQPALARGAGLFPEDSPHSVMFVVADPLKRVVHVLHHSWVPFW